MKKVIPPRPKELIGSLFWMLTYHTGKMLALVALIAAAVYLILCFSCQVETPWGSIGSKPVETKVNINK